jgi:hypothetical protein
MNASNLQNLLDLNWNLLKQALPSFERSLVKCRDLDFSLPISFETEESLDALSVIQKIRPLLLPPNEVPKRRIGFHADD